MPLNVINQNTAEKTLTLAAVFNTDTGRFNISDLKSVRACNLFHYADDGAVIMSNKDKDLAECRGGEDCCLVF